MLVNIFAKVMIARWLE